MLSSLASILITLAAALLKTVLQQRQAANDAHEVGRLTGVVAGLEAANYALTFKAEAAADPVAAGELVVRDGARAVQLPGADPDPPGSAH